MRFIIIFLIPILLFIVFFKPQRKIFLKDPMSNGEALGLFQEQEVKDKIFADQIPKSPIEFLFINVLKIAPGFRWYNLYFENNSYYVVGEKEVRGESDFLKVRLSSFPDKIFEVKTGERISFPYDSGEDLHYTLGLGSVIPSREYLEKISTQNEKGDFVITTKIDYTVYARPTLMAIIIQFALFLFTYWAIITLIVKIVEYLKSGITT